VRDGLFTRGRSTPKGHFCPAAFDNNPATRWNSGQPLRPGMWLELDFGGEERIDSVVVDCGADQSETRIRLEFESAPGRWVQLGGEAAVHKSEVPPGLRSAAIATLKLNRVNWLLVNDHDAIADDINPHPEAWGVRRIAADGEWRLYSLNGW